MPKILPIVVVLIVWFHIITKEIQKRNMKKQENFWNREALSNSVRKKSLDNLNYINFSIDKLPLIKEPNDVTIAKLQDTIMSLSNEKVVNMSNMTNTDVKLEYGTANLDIISQYEQNYIGLIRSLFLLGKRLYELNYIDEALQVLEYGIECNSDLSEHYILLGKIYASKNNYTALNSLIQKATTLNTPMKKKIIRSLEELTNHN